MSNLTSVDVSELVSPRATTTQECAKESVTAAATHIAELLLEEEVTGDHRKQLVHALNLLVEAEGFLGPVETTIIGT